MSLQYTRAELKSRINAGIKNKQGVLVSFNDLVNQAVRDVITDIDLRSTKRTAQLVPNLVSGAFDYPAPSDLKAQSIIDIFPTANRRERADFNLVLPEEFDRRREAQTVAVDDSDTVKTLRISAPLDDTSLVLSEFDQLGSWAAYGEGTNLSINTDNYLMGYGSLSWDITGDPGETVAGIVNTALDFDWTDYRNQSLYVWQYFSNITGIDSMGVRVGQDASNYVQATVTVQSDLTAFRVGWNLLRFDLSTASITGTIDTTSGAYVAIYMNKQTSKVSQTGFLTDYAILRKGQVHEVSYYTKYGWQSAAGAYIENSTNDSDFVAADTDEFNLMVYRGISLAAREIEEWKILELAQLEYKDLKDNYTLQNPSQSKIITSTYYNF